MKIVLALFCGLMLLFAGGCVLTLFTTATGLQAFAVALMPAAVAGLNLLVLIGLFRSQPPQRWAFYLLAAVDLAVAVVAAFAWSGFGTQMADIAWLALPLIAFFLTKAVLTVLMARRRDAVKPPEG